MTPITPAPRPAPDRAPVVVRDATLDDVEAIRSIAVSAWPATYAGLISDEAIERFTATAYTAERIALRIERHVVLVAGTGDGPPEAFVESVAQGDHVQIVAIYARPDARGTGLGSALLAEVRDAHPGEDIAADVLLGNDLGEPFYAARGFVPGELLVDEIAGEEIRERRWWLRAG